MNLSTSYHHVLRGLAFSPDSTQLAVAFHKHISLVDIGEREEVQRFECGADCAMPTFSPDDKFIAALSWRGPGSRAHQGLVHVWVVETGKERAVNPVGMPWCGGAIRFAPASQTLTMTQPDDTIAFWDAASSREVRRLTFPQGAPCSFVFTPDGRALIGGGAEPIPVVHMWDANTGKELQHWDLTSVLNVGRP